MKKIVAKTVDFLLLKFIKDADLSSKVKDIQLRQKYAFLEAYISIIGNFILAGIKVFFGLMLNSISLLADAIHTASDVITSIIVIVGFKLSTSPADEKHPYGHGRMEFLVTLAIAIMLFMVGIKFGKSSYYRLQANTPVNGNLVVVFVMIIGAIIKEWMALFSIDLGERIDAPALMADAWHHRTDAIASVLVAFAILSSMYGYYKLDAILGLGVCILIIYTGIELAINSISKLLGEMPKKSEIDDIKKYALSIPGVSDVHNIQIHDYGARKEISLHIKVDHDLPVIKAHEISEQVEKAIEKNINSTVVVHIEPFLTNNVEIS